MREAPTSLHQYASQDMPEIGHVLELLEIAWERSRSTLNAAPLSTAQMRVMYIIEREPGINLSTLGLHLSAAAPSVTRLCDRLQAAGYLRRTPRPQDRREMQLELTDTGIAHLHDIRHRRETALHQVMKRMTPDAQHALATGLSALCQAASESPPALTRHETA
ncbi:MarR family winged helix-turn-helix transcriptional regulator [Streptomyces fagopyri]|uniref:MarR family winged helix-turn-helix transcriptional regulator n=1 Tax=Streptomyces fagopyri TaxID=2662397 RepID=UPI0033C7B602